jgi:DNA-binding NarL/FixJ family response regulator
MGPSTTVALVDDHQLFLDGLRAVIATQPDMRVVVASSSAATALTMLQQTHADVVVMDLMMPGISGLTLARELLRNDPQRRMLALSMVADEPSVAEAFRAGVLGYACKSQPAEEVVEAIRGVARGAPYLAPELAEKFPGGSNAIRTRQTAHPLSALTQRERQVFELTVAGKTTRDVAKELNISRRTVETHRSRVLHKLGVHSALDLVRLAASWGLLPEAR